MPGPGEYLSDATEGLTRVQDLLKPKIIQRSRDYPRRPRPQCGHSSYRHRRAKRLLHDLGDLVSGRPRDIHLPHSVHHRTKYAIYFNADMSDVALPKSHYTHRVVAVAVRLVVEDGLPYQAASWHVWRDHGVFVPWATIHNWVEAGGKKGGVPHRGQLSRLGAGRLLRVHRGRRVVRRAVLRTVDHR